jgi:AmiR/NasT family two-component response regulator
VLPRLQTALSSRVVVEQAKGFLRQSLGVSVEEAFALLRRYARAHGDHLTEVSRRLMAQPGARPEILAALSQIAASPS